MQNEHDENISAAQKWIVHLKPEGESLLEKLIGPSDLKKGILPASL